jgi:hypothetical protein
LVTGVPPVSFQANTLKHSNLVNNSFYFIKRILLHVQQKLHVTLIGLVNGSPISEIPFSFCTFFSQNVAFVGMFPFNFPCSGEPETFFGAGIRFHLWHNPTLLKCYQRTVLFLFR